jgi:hypothetical protein
MIAKLHTRCAAVAIGIVALLASPATASDFGPMAWQALFTLAAVGALALVLGAITSAVLAMAFRRKSVWFLIPVFTVCWFLAIFGLWQLSMWYTSRTTVPEEPVQLRIPSPEEYSAPESESK